MKVTPSTILACTAVLCGLPLVVWLFVPAGETRPAPSSISEPTVAPPAPNASTKPSASAPWPEVTLSVEITSDELLQLARRLVAQDVARSLAWAQSQTDPTLCARALFAVLQAWGELDPQSAVTWALAQDEAQRFANMDAALSGAAQHPEAALKIVRDLRAQDATSGESYATMLIGAFTRGGDFTSALNLLTDAPASERSLQANSIFSRWGQTQPEAAVKALDSLPDTETRAAAFTSLVEGWGNSNPTTLADYAIKLPTGDDRVLALKTALESWTRQDPTAMTTWLNQFAGSPAFDYGAATMLVQTDGANRDIPLALTWVESIRDEELRLIALERVAQEWAATDRTAAEKFLNESQTLSAEQRQQLLNAVAPRPARPDAD